MGFGAIYHNYYDNQAYGRQSGRAGAGRTNKDDPEEHLDPPPTKNVKPTDLEEHQVLLGERLAARLGR